jgi:hypothetical protein
VGHLADVNAASAADSHRLAARNKGLVDRSGAVREGGKATCLGDGGRVGRRAGEVDPVPVLHVRLNVWCEAGAAEELDLIRDAYHEHGDGLVVANSLGKGSVAVWDLAKRISPEIRAFIGGAGRRRAGRGRLVRPDESSLRRGLVRP